MTDNAGGSGMEAMQGRRFRIPGDTVNKATADLPDEQRNAIRWLHSHAWENDIHIDELGRLVRYDGSTLHRVFHGKYEGSLDNIVREIVSAKDLIEERAKGRKLQFTPTKLTIKIWKCCDAALEFQRIQFIYGDSQTGKTTALLAYRDAHNHGATIYVRVPTGGSLTMFLSALAKTLRISPQCKEREIRRRITESFDDRMLLIVDEAHQCVIGTGELMRPVRTLEFIRELHDESRCGVVICGTNVLRHEMDEGRMSGILLQLKRRRLTALQIPTAPSAADLNTFAAAYGLPPAAGADLVLQTDVIREEALGMWLTLLRMGAKVANKANQKMGWQHVQKAYAGLKSLEGGAL